MDFVRKSFKKKDYKNKIYRVFKDNFCELFDTIKAYKTYMPNNLKDFIPKTIKFRPTKHNGRTLFLDLDETLIHTEYQTVPACDNIEFMINGTKTYLKINVRPYMYEL